MSEDIIKKLSETDLKLVFSDVLKGHTEVHHKQISEDVMYIRHLGILDNIQTDRDYEDSLKIAKDKKLPTEADQVRYLQEEKIWTSEDEARISELKIYISNLKDTKAKLFLKSQIDPIRKDIEESGYKMLRLLQEKEQYLGFTAEKYASKRANENHIQRAVYKDSSFATLAISDEEFNDLSDKELGEFTRAYNAATMNMTMEELKKISLIPFFCNYFYLCDDNPQTFYGKPVVDLTFFQAEIFAYGRYFKSLAQDSKASPPDDIRNDPDKLIDFYEMRKVADETMEKIEQKAGDKSGASTLVGATADDLEAIGYKEGGGKTIDLTKAAEGKGGSLSMDDFLDLHG